MCQLWPDSTLLHAAACKFTSVCWHKSPFFSPTLFKQLCGVCLHMYLYTQEAISPHQLLTLLTSLLPTAWWTAKHSGEEGEPRGLPERQRGRISLHSQHRAWTRRLLPPKLPVWLETTCFHFWVPPICSWVKRSCLGAGCSQCSETRPSPSCHVCASVPAAFSDAKSFLTLTNCPVTFGNSRVWQPTISSQTGELTTASNPCQRTSLGTDRSSPTLQRPYLLHKAKINLPVTLQPPCSLVKGAERTWSSGWSAWLHEAGGCCPSAWLIPQWTLLSQGSVQRDLRQTPPQTGRFPMGKVKACYQLTLDFFRNISLSFISRCCFSDLYWLRCLIWLQKTESDELLAVSREGRGRALPLAGFRTTTGGDSTFPHFSKTEAHTWKMYEGPQQKELPGAKCGDCS